jgi:hypothetical protein
MAHTAAAQTATLPRLPRFRVPGSRRLLLPIALVGFDLTLALAASGSSGDGKLVLIGVLAVLAIASCVLVPWQTLLVLAALWAPTRTLLADLALGNMRGFDLTVSRVLGVLVLVGFGAFLLLRPGKDRPALPTPLCALALVLVAFAFAVSVASSFAGLADFIRVASGIVIALTAYRLVDSIARLLTLTRVVVIAGVVVATVTILQFTLLRVSPGLAGHLFGPAFYTRSHDVQNATYAVRVDGPLGGPGETAGVLLIAFAFALVRYSIRRDRGTRVADVLPLFVLALGVLATLTRAAAVGLLILLLVWSLQPQLRAVSAVVVRVRIAVVVVAVALLAVPVLGAETIQSRFSDVNPVASGQSFAQGRGAVWSEELAVMKSGSPIHLLVGHGAHSSYIRDRYIDGAWTEDSPHNVPLWLLVEMGLLGAAVYAAFALTLVQMLYRTARSGRFTAHGKVAAVALAAVVAYFVRDLFTLSVAAPGDRWYFMLFVGAALGACLAAARATGSQDVAASR